MNATRAPKPARFASFRTRLQVAMMLVVATLTTLGLYIAQRNLEATASRERQREFERELDAMHRVQDVRHAALEELGRVLVRKPRIHAALEDGAPDLLYPSARDALRELMANGDASSDKPGRALHAKFYRFLNAEGSVIPPGDARDTGELDPAEEARLSLKKIPERQQLGYLRRNSGGGGVDEIIATPIISTETGEVIAAIVLGFEPAGPDQPGNGARLLHGIWLNDELHLPELDTATREALSAEVGPVIARNHANSVEVSLGGAPHLLFFKVLNPTSLFPPAYEFSLHPLAEALEQQRHLRWQILSAGVLLLLVGLVASHFIATALSKPVEKLAVDSEQNREGRERAEAELEQTNVELQRSIRFSSDASHQLKTPVTVLRAGLEELLAKENIAPEMREELSSLVGQTSRLTGVIKDLLLLSQMDEGRLRLEFTSVNLTELIEAWLDDFSALEDPFHLTIETGVTQNLLIVGEKRYTSMIVQNLLENARKYNRIGGVIRIRAHRRDAFVILSVANTGNPIPPEAQQHIFERFHRGASGENIPGHGLGLNLARELARLHEGDLRLMRSDASWTEFEVRFRVFENSSATHAATA
ncbi:MAG: HAMP domain-containing histidine kinase [Verrucomicrobia bacterium]|nr:HAMP domain-containing histidine kinase [Verrucomicrobiota bacterium]